MAKNSMQIDISGARDARMRIARYQVRKFAATKNLVVRTANNILRNARRRAPVKSGRLRKSIVRHFNDTKTAAFVRAVAPHAHLVEFGTAQGAGPRPFLFPAAEGQRSKYNKELEKIFGGVE